MDLLNSKLKRCCLPNPTDTCLKCHVTSPPTRLDKSRPLFFSFFFVTCLLVGYNNKSDIGHTSGNGTTTCPINTPRFSYQYGTQRHTQSFSSPTLNSTEVSSTFSFFFFFENKNSDFFVFLRIFGVESSCFIKRILSEFIATKI